MNSAPQVPVELQQQQQQPQAPAPQQQGSPSHQPQQVAVQQQAPQQMAPMGMSAGAPPGAQYHTATLYVGDLSPDVTEALLFDIFNAVGPVASVRVNRDNVTRRSLGYAYVNFHNVTDAERALDTMNYTLIKTQPCRIMWSQRDPSLRKTGAGNVIIKNLDPSIDNKALFDTFSLFGAILSGKVATDRNGNSKGYGFVHFETTEAADEAIAKTNGMLIAGREVFVGKFVKRPERPGSTDWTNVFVKNIPMHWDKQRLEDEFNSCGPISSGVVSTDAEGKSLGYGFIDFVDHDSAKKAVATMNEKVVLTLLGEETGPEEPAAEEPAAAAPASEEKEKEDKDSSSSSGSNNSNKPAEESASTKEKQASRTAKPTKTQTLFVARFQKKVDRMREMSQKAEAFKLDRMHKFQGVNLFVKNLHEDVDDDILRQEFSPFGAITSARVMRELNQAPPASPSAGADSSTEEGSASPAASKLPPSKGFGFVCFSTPEEATKAVAEMNGKLIKGKPVYVALAQPKEARRAQLEAQMGQRGVVGMGGHRGAGGMGPMGAPAYMGAPMYYQAGPGPMGGPMGGQMGQMGGMPMRGGAGGGMGNMAYFPAQQPMMQRPMPNGGNMGPMGMPRGAGGPMGPGGFGGRPSMFPPNAAMMYNAAAAGGMGGQMPMGVMGPGGAGRVRRGGRQGGSAGNPGGRQPRGMPGAPMGMPMGGRMPVQAPSQQQQQPGAPRGGVYPEMVPEPLTAAKLANATEEQQKNMIGERLFPLVQNQQPALAGKITGMLLEMDKPELLNLIESPEALNDKISEALSVLEAHQANPATTSAAEGGNEDNNGTA